MSFSNDEADSHLAIRFEGHTDDLARLMIALARSVGAEWLARSDDRRGDHFELVAPARGVALRALLEPGAVLLELFSTPMGVGFVSELERRLRAVGGHTARIDQARLDRSSKEMS